MTGEIFTKTDIKRNVFGWHFRQHYEFPPRDTRVSGKDCEKLASGTLVMVRQALLDNETVAVVALELGIPQVSLVNDLLAIEPNGVFPINLSKNKPVLSRI